MSEKIKPNQIADTILSALNEYTDDVIDQIRVDVDQVSKETVTDLKRTSPKKTGAYAKGWVKKVVYDQKGRLVVRIYNKNKPSLTHLLEYGHKKRGGGMVPAKQHIRPASESASQKLLQKAKAAIK